VPKTILTDVMLRAMNAPEKGQVTYWDRTLPTFGVRMSQGGSRTFVIQKKGRRTVIGRYPTVSLSQARTEAKRMLAEVTLGKLRPPSTTFRQLVELFFATQCTLQNNKPRTIQAYERIFRRHFLPRIGDRQVAQIRPHDISAIVDGLLPTPIEANHAFVSARALFRFAVRRHLLTHSPCEGMTQPNKPTTRDRTLTDAELAAVYRTAFTFGYPFGPIVQLLILTGQRRGEISGLSWDHVAEQGRTIALPASLTKNNRQHTFPYGPTCADVLSRIPKVSDRFLFPARGNPEQTFSGWSKCKRVFDKACPIAPWTLHDLRRTVATNLAALGTPPHVTERLLNHVSGTVSGVAAIYNRHAYMHEMREALEGWEAKLASLVDGKP
jgi:integrase